MEWEVGLPSTVGGATVGVADIDSAPNGDVLIGGLSHNYTVPPFAGKALARRFDGDT